MGLKGSSHGILNTYEITIKLKIEKHKRNKDVSEWRRLARITNDELETSGLKRSRCTSRAVAP